MNQETGAISSPFKKGILLTILVSSVVLLFFILLPNKGPKGSRIIGEGDRAPEFALASLDGTPVRLSDLRGRVVMVHFWATWCPPCVEEMPTIEKLYRSLPSKDFAILAISVDEGGAAQVAAFLNKNRLSLPVVLDPDHAVASSYGTFKFPETYILDRNGIVKFKVIGPRDWNDAATVKTLQDLAGAS
jgi:peroxiredoxin